jgi:hypothetical protein
MRLMLLLSGLFLALLGGVLVGGVDADVLLVAPLLVLGVPLFGGRYVGEEHLHRLRAAFAAPARRRAPASVGIARRAPLRVVRTGLLLATAHASRPPPALGLTP